MRPTTYAPDESAVRAAESVVRDTRGPIERFFDGAKQRANTGKLLILLALVCLFVPALTEVMLLLGMIALPIGMWISRYETLPMRLPATSGLVDYNDPKPGRMPGKKGFNKARGTFFLGHARGYMPLWWDTIMRRVFKRSFYELWGSATDILTHLLVLGSTGAGKTEALLSYSWNYLTMGAGLIYADAKASPKLPMQIGRMARLVGRDDDLRYMNYFTGTSQRGGDTRLSNTMNPFTQGSAEALSQLLQGLIPSSKGENAIFSEKAVALINSLMYGLVELRDRNEISLSPGSIAEFLSLERCYSITQNDTLSDRARTSMRTFLSTSVGFDLERPVQKQNEEVPRQFGFAQAYFTRALLSLSDTYGHIFNVPFGEIDFSDVVRNRRILAILLPAMEKPPQELLNLGKINLTGLRNAMAEGLGHGIEGTVESVLDSLPTASNIPTGMVIDEYPYIATDGFAIAAAQARGLNVSVAFGGQDIAGFQRANKEEAEQIVANTNVKYLMKLDDPNQTWDLFNKLAGETYVTESGGYQVGQGLGSIGYSDQQSATIQRRSRISIRDAQSQIEGEAHLFVRGNIVRAQVFHAGIDLPADAELRIARHIVVIPPGYMHPLRKQPVRKLLNTLYQITAYRPAIQVNVDGDEDAFTAAIDVLAEAGLHPFSSTLIDRAIAAHTSANQAKSSPMRNCAKENEALGAADNKGETGGSDDGSQASGDGDGGTGGTGGTVGTGSTGGAGGLLPTTTLGDLGGDGVVADDPSTSPLVAIFVQHGQWTWGDDPGVPAAQLLTSDVPDAINQVAQMLNIANREQQVGQTLSDLIRSLVYSVKPAPNQADENKLAAAVLQQIQPEDASQRTPQS